MQEPLKEYSTRIFVSEFSIGLRMCTDNLRHYANSWSLFKQYLSSTCTCTVYGARSSVCVTPPTSIIFFQLAEGSQLDSTKFGTMVFEKTGYLHPSNSVTKGVSHFSPIAAGIIQKVIAFTIYLRQTAHRWPNFPQAYTRSRGNALEAILIFSRIPSVVLYPLASLKQSNS